MPVQRPDADACVAVDGLERHDGAVARGKGGGRRPQEPLPVAVRIGPDSRHVPVDIVRRAVPAGIVCVQNAYSILNRAQEHALDLCMAEDIAWGALLPPRVVVPGFPKVAADPVVRTVADELDVTPSQVGPAWLLAHSRDTLLIAGTRSIAHLEENVGAGTCTSPPTRWPASTPSTTARRTH